MPRDTDEREVWATYAGPDGYIDSVRFVDNTIIETTTRGGTIQYWDIGAGREVDAP